MQMQENGLDAAIGIRNGICGGILLWALLIFIGMSLCKCTNWQGMEFKIGVGTYNGASETKTFTKEDTTKK